MTEPRGFCKLLIVYCTESLRLLNIRFKRPVPPPGPPSAPVIRGIDTTAAVGAKSGTVHTRCDDDDDEEPSPKKTKTDTIAGSRAVKLVLNRPHTTPQSTTEGNNQHNDPTTASVTPEAQAKSHPQPPVARIEVKHDPIVIKDEDEKDPINTSPAPRGSPSEAQSQHDVSTATPQHEDQARRERQKELLNNRLAQLKIQQQLLEMED